MGRCNSYVIPGTNRLGRPARASSLESYSADPLGNVTWNQDVTQIPVSENGYQNTVSPPKTSLYAARTGRLVQTANGIRRDTVLYDPAGNAEFSYKRSSNGFAFLEDRASYYGGDGRLHVSEYRAAQEDNTVSEATWNKWHIVDEYRYDALGRRVLALTRKDTCNTDLNVNDFCRLSTIRRIVWDGAQELYEIQMLGADSTPAAVMETDTGWSFVRHPNLAVQDPNPRFGRVAYTHGPGLDQPLSVTRIEYRDVDTAHVWAPFAIVPHWNWRGQADYGTFGDGGTKRCLTANRCAGVVWRASAFAFARESADTLRPWYGRLIEDAEDGGGLRYRRNRYMDPATGRFTQEDPIGLAGGLNLYGFAAGDPVNFGDPFGLCAQSDTLETVTVQQCASENPTIAERKMCVDRSVSGSVQVIFNLAARAGIPVTMNNAYRDRVTAGTSGRPGERARSLHRAGLGFDVNWLFGSMTDRQKSDFASIAQEYGFYARSDDPGHFEVAHRGATDAEIQEADRSYAAGECTDANVEAVKSQKG